MQDIEKIRQQLRQFAKERDWVKFHSPKNLSIGLSVEASELLEIFTWLTEEQSYKITGKQLEKVKEEVGDILIYIINLCDKLDIDPIECALKKIEINKRKYPIDLVRGKAKKYNEY